MRQFLSGDRRGISISVSDDESEKSFKKLFGNNKKLRGARSSEEFLTSTARKICGDELLNLGRGPGGASAKVCVVLNDDELLLVSFNRNNLSGNHATFYSTVRPPHNTTVA